METMEQKVKSELRNVNPDKREGEVASMIEEQTAKVPSDVFLWASLGAMAASLALKLMKRDEQSLFVGNWATSFLLFGIYNKLVKQHGHDDED
ncbi:MAG: hypothetical protein ACFCUM_10605 [Bacteroidales bacterium]